MYRIDFMYACAPAPYRSGFSTRAAVRAWLEAAKRRQAEVEAASVGRGVIELERHVGANDGEIAERAAER